MDTLLLASRPAGKARATSNTRRCTGVVAAPRRCPTSPSSRRLASARPALAPKCPYYFFTDPNLRRKRTADLPVMAEWIDHAAQTPPVRFLQRVDLSGTCCKCLREHRIRIRDGQDH